MADALDLGPWAEWIRDPALVVEIPSLRIHGWNGSGRQLFGSGAGRATGPDEGPHLPSLMADDAEKMVSFTMLCAGSRQVLPGSVTLRQGDGVKRYQVEGRLIQPGNEDSPTLVGLRFKDPKQAHHRFRLLNEKIEELSKEIGAKQRTERFLDDVRTGFERIALGAPLDETLTHLCRSVEGYAAAGTTASVLLLDRRSGRLRHVGESSLPDEYARAIDGVRIGPAVGSCGTAAYLNEEVVVTDIASDPLWADFKDVALPHGFRACWSTPIPSTDGTVLGTFAFYCDTPRGPTRREIRISGIASRTAAIAIQRDREQARARRLFQRERRSREEAEGANRAKDEFLAVVSHELRNPLSAILGWARLLNDEALDEETRRRGVEAIERNAENQSQLISDVLDYSRASAGSLSLEPTPVPLRELVSKVVDSLTPVAHGAGVELEYHAPPSTPPVLCDRERIYQVLYNLVSNSIKFTPEEGCVTIELEQNDELATLRVTDSGEGIDPAFLPFVFERFRQADSSKT
ncbi:MAG: GAF domain-containing sensor histidine kinase, partial [Gemmatimonadetes bacterium]|nr:GAF domain-containing sensor histidine kinase [Gemmatimonadota bacterium]